MYAAIQGHGNVSGIKSFIKPNRTILIIISASRGLSRSPLDLPMGAPAALTVSVCIKPTSARGVYPVP